MDPIFLVLRYVAGSVLRWGERDETSVFGFILSIQIFAMIVVLTLYAINWFYVS